MMSSPEKFNSSVHIFDDFEEPRLMTTTYCQQLSDQEFQDAVASETDKALGELCCLLDKNPEIYARILRKRKQDEIESNGIVSFMKSKVLGLVHGGAYAESLVTDADCLHQTNALKAGMCKTFQYAQELNKEPVRRSQRIASKRKAKQQQQQSRPVGDRLPEAVHGVSAPPPPPPPLPAHFLSGGRRVNESVDAARNKENVAMAVSSPKSSAGGDGSVKCDDGGDTSWDLDSPQTDADQRQHDGPGSDRKLRSLKRSGASGSTTPVTGTSSLTRIHSELMSSNPISRLRVTSVTRSPGGTPARPAGSSQLPTEPLQKALVTAMRSKFRNIYSPSPLSQQSSSNNSVTFTP